MNNVIRRFKKFFSVQIKATLAFIICSFLQKGISVLTTPIFTRLLTTAEYGYYSLFCSWSELVIVFSTLSLSGSMFTQALIKYEEDKDSLALAVLGLGTVSSIISLVLCIIFRNVIKHYAGIDIFNMLMIVIVSWARFIFYIWSTLQKIEYKYQEIVKLTIFTSLLKPLLGVASILLFPQYAGQARVISIVFVEIIAYIGIFILMIRKEYKKLVNGKYWKYMVALSLPLIPHYLTKTFLNQSDKFMINAIEGKSEVGIYSLAHSLAWLFILFNDGILTSYTPWFFRKMKKREYKNIFNISLFMLLSIALLNLLLIAFAPEIIYLFAPVEYYDAIWCIPPLSASVFFMMIYSIFANVEFYYESSKFISMASVLGGILNIVLNLIFISKYGYIAAAYTTLVCYMIYVLAHYLFMKYLFMQNNEVNIFKWYYFFPLILFFLGTCAALMINYNKLFYRILIIILLCFVVYCNRKRLMNFLQIFRAGDYDDYKD